MRVDDRAHDRQPKPRASGRTGPRGVPARKPLEEVVLEIRGDAGAVIRHRHDRAARPLARERHRNVGARRCVNARIREEVSKHLMDALHIPLDHHRVVREVEFKLVVGACDMRVAHAVDQQPGQVDGRSLDIATGIQPSEEQQVFDE
ncbi:MAG: hypothetical protein JWQ77_4227 [Jatrophihabitans sp.]|nr:hypothetical protein [Jatrophihabitans sp.]